MVLDSGTWGAEIQDGRYKTTAQRMDLSREELHRRLARRWSIVAELNRKGCALIEHALNASPLEESIEDVRFLRTLLTAYQPLTDALEQFHRVLQLRFSKSGSNGSLSGQLQSALRLAEQAHALAKESFPHPIVPVAAQVDTVRNYSDALVQAIQGMLGER